MRTRYFLFISSIILFVFNISCTTVEDLEKLENSIDRHCMSRIGQGSSFCSDYSRLREERGASQILLSNATVPFNNASVSSNKEIVELTKEAQTPHPKAEIGDVVLTEGNTTTVLHKSAEIEQEELEDPTHMKGVPGPPGPIEAGLTAQEIRDELRRIIQEEYIKKELTNAQDDPACNKLRQEYDDVCFATPPLAAFQETREFCLAFVKNCQKSLLTNLFTNLKNFKVDFTAYCKKHRERFRYVCPDPLRFFSFAQDAVEFCVRYKERCPKTEVPAEPIQFKRKNADHIYTREIEFWCTRQKRTAYNYCTEPDLLRTPRYQMFCGIYKYACIDILKRVIYG